MTVRIVLADDQALVRRGLRLILEAEADLEVVGEAEDGERALAAVAELAPDVVLVDLRMPRMDGIEAVARMPDGTRALVLTTFGADDLVYAALRAGASGYLLKTAPPETLVAAVRTVAGGEALLDPRITRRLIQEYVARPAPGHSDQVLAGLTERERDLLRLVARGLSNKEIAARESLSEATVKTYLGRLLAKTGSRDRAQLVVLGYESGLVRPGDA
ncbi:MAG TPA: response regulator transcription factor [Nocardioides sp.]|nr:response regulator transcription factor [Nocardioides sp.]